MRQARRALAASFVATFAGGCDSRSAQPPAAPTVDVGPALAPAAASARAAPAAASSDGGEPGAADAAPVALLPPAPAAPATGRIRQNADGTCTWYADRLPGRPPGRGRVFYNPPPPRRVACPPDGGADGGT